MNIYLVCIHDVELDIDAPNHGAIFEAESSEDAFEDWLHNMVKYGRAMDLHRLARISHPTIEVCQLSAHGTRGQRWWSSAGHPGFSIPPLALEALIAEYLTATRKQEE